MLLTLRGTVVITTVVAMSALVAGIALAPSIQHIAWHKSEQKKVETVHTLNTKITAPIKTATAKISSSRARGHMIPPPPPYAEGNAAFAEQNGIQEWNSAAAPAIALASNPAERANGYVYSKYIYAAQGYSSAQPVSSGHGVTSWTYTR